MPHSELDFRLMLSEDERIQFNEIVTILASIETILAHNPKLVPLDVFLDWSQFVHKWLIMYTFDICTKGNISYRSFKKLILDLQAYQSDFSRKMKNKNGNIVILSTSAVQKAVNMWTEFTVASGDATTYP